MIALIYRVADRELARNVGIQLDETMHPDQMTALNFLVRPGGDTLVIAIFAADADPIYVNRARSLLAMVGTPVTADLRTLLRTAHAEGYTELYLGDEAVRFLSRS